MTRPLDYLYFDDGAQPREIFNGARTMAYLANYSCNLFTQKTAPCNILTVDPCDDTPLNFTDTTTAPWYDGVPGSPSSNAYGFWINEWVGMDGSNIRRAATNLYPRGASFGPLGQAHRVWKMNVMLFGADEVALEDLFRWLEESLLACCQPGVTAWVRTTCPDGYDDDYGLVHVVDLQLLEGVTWISDPADGYGCQVREVTFTLGVGDPCLYGPPENCVEDEPFPEAVLCDIGISGMFGCPSDPDAFADWRICCPVTGRRIGVTAPVVVLHNTSTTDFSPPMRVIGVTNFFDSGCVVGTNAIFGEVRVAGIPPQSELMVDCARRRVLWRRLGFLGPWESGYVYLDRSLLAVPDYPANGCDDGMIFVEPTTITSSLADLTVTVDMVSRYGCC